MCWANVQKRFRHQLDRDVILPIMPCHHHLISQPFYKAEHVFFCLAHSWSSFLFYHDDDDESKLKNHPSHFAYQQSPSSLEQNTWICAWCPYCIDYTQKTLQLKYSYACLHTWSLNQWYMILLWRKVLKHHEIFEDLIWSELNAHCMLCIKYTFTK